MSKPEDLSIKVGRWDQKTTTYRLTGGFARVKDDDGNYQDIAVTANLEIDTAGLQRLINKAFNNRSRKSHDGPVLVRITGYTTEPKP